MPNVAQRYPLNNATSTGDSPLVGWDALDALRTSNNPFLQNDETPNLTEFRTNSAIVTLAANGTTSKYLTVTGFQFADGVARS